MYMYSWIIDNFNMGVKFKLNCYEMKVGNEVLLCWNVFCV